MDPRDDYPDEMPRLPWPRGGEPSPADELAVERLLSGRPLPPDTPAEEQRLAGLLAAAAAPSSPWELRGETAAVAAFAAATIAGSSRPIRRFARRASMLTSALSAKLAIAAAAAAVTVGGVAAAAFTNSLPASAQNVAHDVFGAPAPHSSHVPGANGLSHGGPSASTYGLCTAYAAVTNQFTDTSSPALTHSVAFRRLTAKATAAGETVQAYCAGVKPGPSAHPTGEPNGNHPTGRPTALPTPSHPGKGNHPTGQPTALPTPSHPTSKPSPLPTPSHP
jgi:hypothetical protein